MCQFNGGAIWALDEDTHYALFDALEKNTRLSQRDLAKLIGINLGKVIFLLNAGQSIAGDCRKQLNLKSGVLR